jgi:hypothetical protein
VQIGALKKLNEERLKFHQEDPLNGATGLDQVIGLLNQLWIYSLRGHPKQRPKVFFHFFYSNK